MDRAREAILAFKPVTFRYKNDRTNTPQFGLIAEEVEKVDPELVVRGRNGELLSVRYDQVNAMLLNEFLKAHHRLTRCKSKIEALAEGLQKVSAHLEASKPAPQVVKNRQ
jgi:hypothetical protein